MNTRLSLVKSTNEFGGLSKDVDILERTILGNVNIL